MSKTRDTGFLANVIQVHDTGVRIMSGSTMLMAVSSSGAVTITGEISGSDAANALLLSGTGSVGFTTTSSFLAVSSSQQEVSSSLLQVSASYISLSGSYNTFSGSASTRITENSSSIQQVSSSQQQISSSLLQVSASYISLSGSYTTFSGSASTRTTQIENVYATTGSNSFRANQSITGSLVVSSTITAQTLVVQTVTSSIVYSSGSNIFGSALSDRQTFTGSVLITGSLTIAGASSATSYSGATIYGSTAVCSAVGKFTSCIDAGAATFSSDVAISGSSGALYSLGQLGFTNTGAGGQYGIYTLGTATPTMYFDHRATGNTGQWVWRSGTGGATTALTLSNAGAATFSSTITGTTIYGSTTVCSPVGYFSGCVGIGTCTPTDKLQILGSLRWGSASNYLVSSNDGTGVYMELAGTSTATRQLRIQGINNAANSYSSIRLEAGISEIAFTTIDLERMRITSAGITCFACQVCAPTFAGSTVRGSSNLDLNGNSGYLTLRTGDTTRLYVGSTGGVSVGAVSDPGVNNFIVAGTICSAGQVKGSSLFAGGPACGSGWRLGGSTYNTAYEGDGLWGTNSTPNFIQSPVGLGMRIGYTDNGSGLYGAAYGFDVSYKDGLNNCIDYNAIIMRNSGQGTTPFRVTSYGNIYGTSKNFRIKHPIPSMNDTHYLIHTSIEGPQADLIYRGKVQLVNGKAEVNIDLASRMTDGTFEALCQDVQSYTTNESGWSLTKSYVVENILHIEAQDETSDDTISWLVIGERNDDGIKNSAITDENGHVIVEELKPEEGL